MAALIICSHRELLAEKPGWREHPDDPDCAGALVVVDSTTDLTIWTAECDVCGLQLGITPRQQQALFDRMRRL